MTGPKKTNQTYSNTTDQSASTIDRLTQEQATASNAIQIPQISLPKGGGALKGIDEKFEVNSANGTSSFSIPLPITPSRNGFNPNFHDFPNVWHQFVTGNSNFKAVVKKEYFNYLTQGKTIAGLTVNLHQINGNSLSEPVDIMDNISKNNDEWLIDLDRDLIDENGFGFLVFQYSLTKI